MKELIKERLKLGSQIREGWIPGDTKDLPVMLYSTATNWIYEPIGGEYNDRYRLLSAPGHFMYEDWLKLLAQHYMCTRIAGVEADVSVFHRIDTTDWAELLEDDE